MGQTGNLENGSMFGAPQLFRKINTKNTGVTASNSVHHRGSCGAMLGKAVWVPQCR